jgi:hypothetical protein
LFGYALAGSAAWGFASLAESPIDFYKSQMQKQLIAARVVRAPRREHCRAPSAQQHMALLRRAR